MAQLNRVVNKTKLTAAQMNQALHLYRQLTTVPQVLCCLGKKMTSGTENDYEVDLAILMSKGCKCYYSLWDEARKTLK